MAKVPESIHPDLSPVLEDWPFAAGQLNVRMIEGLDGESRIQIRLDLGILQLHTTGRPDGQRPQGYPSYLDYCEARVGLGEDGGQELLDESENDEDGEAEVSLDDDECRMLREEAAQYYHRYMALLLLEEFDGVIRDTSRNLRVLDLCAKHAEQEHDRQVLEPYRPYILMIRARALAGQALKDGEAKAAILAIDQGLDALRGHFTHAGTIEDYESSSEVQMLRAMREALVPKLPVSQRAELRQRLQAAVEQENYELAAILRDELRLLGDSGGAA